jgi:hypothetical protein
LGMGELAEQIKSESKGEWKWIQITFFSKKIFLFQTASCIV